MLGENVRKIPFHPIPTNPIATNANTKNLFDSDPTAEKKPTLRKTTEGKQPFVAYWLIGGASNNASLRRIGWGVATRGWNEFIQEKIVPQIQVGVRRFHLHNPFGLDASGPMPADQYIKAVEQGLDLVYGNFVEAWKPIADNPNFEVTAYLGKLPDSAIFNELIGLKDSSGWMKRLTESYQAVMEAGMSIGFDAMAIAEDSDESYLAYDLIDKLCQLTGRRTYIEATPKKRDEHLTGRNIFVIDSTWRTRLTLPAFAHDEDLSGEIVRLAVKPRSETRTTLEWCLGIGEEILADGHTFCPSQGWQLSMDELAHLLRMLRIL
tara:strand:+ start:32150 stop:33112 length:963 start_codon:yes stop_codon:yes gene_type:complete